MNNSSEKIVKTLNNLIETNNDRVAGYETAAKETHDEDLKTRFLKNAAQSSSFRNELISMVHEHGGKPAEGSTAAGTVYRGWMEVRSSASGDSQKSILSLCEFGEDNAKKSYMKAIEEAASYPENVRDLINRQSNEIMHAHDEVKQLRDLQHH